MTFIWALWDRSSQPDQCRINTGPADTTGAPSQTRELPTVWPLNSLQVHVMTKCVCACVCVKAGTPQCHNYHRDLALYRLVRSEMNTSRVQVKLVEYTSCSTSPKMSVCISNRCIYYGGLKDAQYGVLALIDVERQLHSGVFYIQFNVIIDLVV